MLWPATFSALSALFTAAAGLTGDTAGGGLHVESIQHYIEALTQDLPEEHAVRKNVVSRLRNLPSEQVRQLHVVCCAKSGECKADAAAFLVMEYENFDPRRSKSLNAKARVDGKVQDEFTVDTFATYLGSHFLDYVKKLGDIPLDLTHPEELDEGAVLKGIGQWYRDAGYKIDSGDALKEALVYIAFSDDRPDTAAARARILLRLVGAEDSPVLLDYWKRQPASRQLMVYLHASRDKKYGDLAILQPIIFNMDCIRNGSCFGGDYVAAFGEYAASVALPVDSLRFIPKRLGDSLFPKVAKVLRNMTRKITMENLRASEKDVLQYFTEERGLSKELAFNVLISGPNVLSVNPKYVILNPEMEETWEVLDNQMVRLSLNCVDFVEAYGHFPHHFMAKYIPRQYESLSEYVMLYAAGVDEILENVLRVKDRAVLKTFQTGTIWKVINFLENHVDYRSLFGWMFMQNADQPDTDLYGAAPKGVGALMLNITDYPDKETYYPALCEIVARFVRGPVGSRHLLFEDQFKPALEQIQNAPFRLFDKGTPTWDSLNQCIFGVPAETGTPGGLHDLQVALVVGKACRYYQLQALDADLKALEKMLREYSTAQLENIHSSKGSVHLLFRHSRLRELAPDLFKFDCRVDTTQIFALLLRIYRRTHSDSPAFDFILKTLSRETEAEWPFSIFSQRISVALWELPPAEDLLGNSGRYWEGVERKIYVDSTGLIRSDAIAGLGPKITAAPLVKPSNDAIELAKTFDELLSSMIGLGKIQQARREQLVQGLPISVKKRVLGALSMLELKELEELYSACCPGGQCLEGAAAFLADYFQILSAKRLAELASWLPSDFMDFFGRSASALPGRSSLGRSLDKTAFLKGLGLWHSDNGFKVQGRSQVYAEAFPYVILADKSELNKRARAEAMLSITWRQESEVLLKYWRKQGADRQLAVYRNASCDKSFGHLVILQPIIFGGMKCIQSRTCRKSDYSAVFKSRTKAMFRPNTVPRLILEDKSLALNICVSAVVHALKSDTELDYVILDPAEVESRLAPDGTSSVKKDTLYSSVQSRSSAPASSYTSISSSGSPASSAPSTSPPPRPSPAAKPAKLTTPRPKIRPLALVAVGLIAAVLGVAAACYYFFAAKARLGTVGH